MKNHKKYYLFKKLVDKPYMEHIYPIKQKDIAYLIDHLPSDVQKIYVFGSSITLDCGRDSDIDLLIIAEKTDELYKAFSEIFKQLESEVDLIIKTKEEFYSNLNDSTSICTIVERKGLLIYERTI